jgi:hypothetical protein
MHLLVFYEDITTDISSAITLRFLCLPSNVSCNFYLDFKLSPCSECRISSAGCLTGVCSLTTVKPAYTGPPIYQKPGQTENKFRNGVISCVK